MSECSVGQFAYRIRHWDKVFENSLSRKYKRLNWVRIPNIHDTCGYRTVIERENGVEIFGAWVLIVQVASKMPIRGTLAGIEVPLTAADLARKTGGTEQTFVQALNILSHPTVNWLERVKWPLVPASAGLEPIKSDSNCGEHTNSPTTDTISSQTETAATSQIESPLSASNQGSVAGSSTTMEESSTTLEDCGYRLDKVREDKIREDKGRERHTLPTRPDIKQSVEKSFQRPSVTRQSVPANVSPEKFSQTVSTGSGRVGSEEIEEAHFRHIFVLKIIQALGCDAGRMLAQRRPLLAVARAIQHRPDRDKITEQMIRIAKEKQHAGLDNPAAAWQVEIDQKYPRNPNNTRSPKEN